ncbi:MAG: hypothetical protein FJ150_03700 [Euryarchaeota archaeon]|nr:hypothetical protein [Euryarchaeota archaeon]
MNKISVAIVIVVLVAVLAAGYYLTMQTPTKNTTNNTNNTTNNTNNTTPQNNTTIISAEKAKEVAQQYIGMGVYLGTPTLTKFNDTQVWKVPVYTTQGKYVDSIYVDAHTAKRVISPEMAKEAAQNFTGMGVSLGTPTLTTLNGVKVWKVPVYTTQGKYVDSIYINAETGEKIQ